MDLELFCGSRNYMVVIRSQLFDFIFVRRSASLEVIAYFYTSNLRRHCLLCLAKELGFDDVTVSTADYFEVSYSRAA